MIGGKRLKNKTGQPQIWGRGETLASAGVEASRRALPALRLMFIFRADLLPRADLVCVVVASGVECRAMARKPNGTSREHILSRLERDGRQLLLDAVRQRRISAYTAAELAGYVRRRPTLFGDQSQQARRRRHEIARLLG